jgi:hypothetical protein
MHCTVLNELDMLLNEEHLILDAIKRLEPGFNKHNVKMKSLEELKKGKNLIELNQWMSTDSASTMFGPQQDLNGTHPNPLYIHTYISINIY